MSSPRDKVITKAVADGLKYLDENGDDGITRLLDKLPGKIKGSQHVVEALQALVDKPSLNAEGEFAGSYPGGLFTQFVIKVVTKELNDKFPKGIPDVKKANQLAKAKAEELFDLFKRVIIHPISNSKVDILPLTAQTLVEDMQSQVLEKEDPKIYDLYEYLFYDQQRPYRTLLRSLGVADLEPVQEAKESVTVSAAKRMEKIYKLQGIEADILKFSRYNNNQPDKYLSNYDLLMIKLKKYRSYGILSQDHYDYLKQYYVHSYGAKAEAIRAEKAKPKPSRFLSIFSGSSKDKKEVAFSPTPLSEVFSPLSPSVQQESKGVGVLSPSSGKTTSPDFSLSDASSLSSPTSSKTSSPSEASVTEEESAVSYFYDEADVRSMSDAEFGEYIRKKHEAAQAREKERSKRQEELLAAEQAKLDKQGRRY